VLEAIRALKGQKTMLLIAHRSSVAAIGDRVLALEDGQLRPAPPSPEADRTREPLVQLTSAAV
jgi:ABC-type transport system involved in cytochrome bd biosynthesis fused ATPase/permease subunit